MLLFAHKVSIIENILNHGQDGKYEHVNDSGLAHKVSIIENILNHGQDGKYEHVNESGHKPTHRI